MTVCDTCGCRIELGSSITKGCKECFDTAISMREEAVKRGMKLPPTAPWVGKVQAVWDKFTNRLGGDNGNNQVVE